MVHVPVIKVHFVPKRKSKNPCHIHMPGLGFNKNQDCKVEDKIYIFKLCGLKHLEGNESQSQNDNLIAPSTTNNLAVLILAEIYYIY